ncbi:endonuclease/exonuclease/phosphatase family protein [Phaeacidiphilus oryzae]|uniref:endonuclease/exonuclease/phosphatase family protein n=1 Tax=Phaeacidiphilus oryzae TaxID=348818 RepID=UPI000565AFE8|nr:endonuclease/exonuclease/phosphatase family protein [Phaeacidiphilus oryzae]
MTTARTPGPEAGARLRVATLNLWGTRGDWPARRERLAAGFAEISPDLVVLQETILTDEYDQVRDLLGEEYHVVHQSKREPDGQGVSTASRLPLGEVSEVDLQLTPRTLDFACTSLLAEVLAPPPFDRIWLLNHFPSWRLDLAYERERQAVVAARVLQDAAAARPGHQLVAGDLDADPDSSSIRFWTGRQSLESTSVCFRDAWESTHGRHSADRFGHTYVPDNPHSVDWDWPFRRIDYLLVGCGHHGGPTLAVRHCVRAFDRPWDTVSDHYGLVADLVPAPG